jgi:hypothetical protein
MLHDDSMGQEAVGLYMEILIIVGMLQPLDVLMYGKLFVLSLHVNYIL